MKDAYYFSHDSNARHDPKILEMRAAYGAKGYGWYWMIIEILRDQEDYRIKVKSNVYAGLALDLNADKEELKQFITDCINEFELLESDGNYVWSNSLKQRMEYLDRKREKARIAANKRWGNRHDITDDNVDAMQMQCDSNASKVKESKLNEIKVKEETVSDKPDTHNHTESKNPVVDTKSNSPPYDEIIKLYNKICESFPKVKVLSDGRRNQIRLRWSKYGKQYGIKFFEELFERSNDSAFLSGSNGKWQGCNFDWLVKEANMIKVMEGNYEN